MSTRSYRLYLVAAACAPLLSAAVSAAAQVTDAGARSLAATCFTCHGTDGRSAGGVPPSLAGMDRAYLVRQMQAFKAGTRPATLMHQYARGYSDAELDQIAAYFAAARHAPAAPSATSY